jgi:hypothetical protein
MGHFGAAKAWSDKKPAKPISVSVIIRTLIELFVAIVLSSYPFWKI